MPKTDIIEARRALRRKKRDKKGGGFWLLWNKIRSALGLVSEGAGTESGAATSAASRAAAEALEAGQGLGRVSVLSPQAAIPASQSSVWATRAALAAAGMGVFAAGALGLSHVFSNSSAQGGPHFGPIASMIHIFRPQYGASHSNNNSLGSGNSASSLSSSAGKSASPNSGKTGNAASAKNSGKTSAFPSAFNGLPSAKLSTDLNDGGPVAAQSLKEAGQAAQEAALVKNGGFSANNKIAVTPMVATALSPYLVAGVSIGTKGRGFSRSYGGLRGMSEYVHPMDASASGCASGDSSCDSAAGNAINQWQNAPIVNSGQGISMGGADAGTADNPPPANASSGGGGTGGNYANAAGDISNVCSADQIQKGYVSNGGACVPGFTPGPGNNASPWQNDLATANLLIEAASGMVPIALLLIAIYWQELSIPIVGTLDALAWETVIDTMAAIVFAMGAYVTYLGFKIGSEGGHSQSLETAIMGGAIAAMGATMWLDEAGDLSSAWEYAILGVGSVGIMITKLLGG